MIDPQDDELSLVRQCALVGIARSSFYYRPVGESQANLRLMRLMDELHLNCPWYDSRQMARALRRRGHRVGRKRVRRLMRVMGLRSLAPRPNTSRRAPGHRVYPYLLRDLAVGRPNRVWCADLTYLPMGARLFVPGGDHGLVFAQGAVLPSADHHRHLWIFTATVVRL